MSNNTQRKIKQLQRNSRRVEVSDGHERVTYQTLPDAIKGRVRHVTDVLGGTLYFGNGTQWRGIYELPQFEVLALPTLFLQDGTLAYAINGLKQGESIGAGTGVPVYFSNGAWYRFSDDTAVTA